MGIRPRPPMHDHRKGKPCPECIRSLEIECGMRPAYPLPPSGRGAGVVAVSAKCHVGRGWCEQCIGSLQ